MRHAILATLALAASAIACRTREPAQASSDTPGDVRLPTTWASSPTSAVPATSSLPNVLAQTDADPTDYRFPLAWASESSWKDVEASVHCKPVSGKVDQACGLVFRLRDANNYYLTRANALENNVRLYFVKEGRRETIASWSGKVTSGAWHELKARAQGDHLVVSWDGTLLLDHHDTTFSEAVKVVGWTKA